MGGRARPSSLNISGEHEDDGCSCDKQRNNGNNCVCGEKHSLRPLQTPVGKSGFGFRIRIIAANSADLSLKIYSMSEILATPILTIVGLTRLLVDEPYKNLVLGTQCGFLCSLTQG
jgi:hypothetical protein